MTIEILTAKWNVFWETLPSYGQDVVQGLLNTLQIAGFGFLLGLVIGALLALAKLLPPYRMWQRVLSRLADAYIALFRGTPIVAQLLIGWYFLKPLLGLDALTAETSCIIIFGLNSGAYVAEIMRGGILSVPKGQLEAGRALGLSYAGTMGRVILPQAFRNTLPTLGNELISLVKETSVVSFVGALDLYNAVTKVGSEHYEFMIPYLFLAVIYLVLILVITALLKLLEKQLRKRA